MKTFCKLWILYQSSLIYTSFFYSFLFIFLFFLFFLSSFFLYLFYSLPIFLVNIFFLPLWLTVTLICNFSPSGNPGRFLTPTLAQSSAKPSHSLEKKSYIAAIYLYISSGHYQLFLGWGRVCQHTQSLCRWSFKKDFPCNIVNWLTFRPGKKWEYQSSNIFSCFPLKGTSITEMSLTPVWLLHQQLSITLWVRGR